MAAYPPVTVTQGAADSAASKVRRRVLPFVAALYILNFLDRVNVSYAAADMSKDLGFTPATYGLGAGIFFLTYFLFEIPGSLLVARKNPQLWLSGMALAWGIVAASTGFVASAGQFYGVRLLLGAAEAGCFPGMILYLNRWSSDQGRAQAFAFLVAGLPVANLFAAPLSSALLGVHWLGLAGWRWLFIAEAVPTILLAAASAVWLPEAPASAPWLTHEEKAVFSGTSVSEPVSPRLSGSLPDVSTTLLSAAWFLFNVAVYGFTFWLPLVLKRLTNLSPARSALLAALPFAIALAGTVMVSRSSDVRRERHWHAGIPMAIFGLFLGLSVLTTNKVDSITMLCLAGLGINSGTASFLILCSDAAERGHRAFVIGVITSCGALGGFAGPWLMGVMRQQLGSFAGPLLCLSSCGVLAGALAVWSKACSRSRTVSHL